MVDRPKFRRFPNIVASEVDGEIFVCDDVNGAIHSLGQTGSALWRLLETPKSRKDCIAVFRTAYPDEKPKRVRKIVRETIRSLRKRGIIYRDGD